MLDGAAVREVLLDRDVRAPEILSASTASRGYLLRRYASITCLMLVDVLSLLAAAMVVDAVRAGGAAKHPGFPTLLLAAMALALVGAAATNRLYGLREARRLRRRRLRAAFWFVAAALIIAGVSGFDSPGVVIGTTLVGIAFLTAGRELFDLALRVVFGLDTESRRTILVGSPAAYGAYQRDGRMLARRERSRVLGIVGDPPIGSRVDGRGAATPLGVLRDIERIVDLWRPDELVVVDQDVELHHLGDLADLCRRRHMTLKLMDLEMRFSGSGVCLIPGLGEALFVAAPAVPSGAAWVIKRCTDVALSAALLVLLSPLLALIAVAVKLTSPGRVFYSAERVGLGQNRFHCHKFRTMREDAEHQQAGLEELNEADGAIFKIHADPRVTRVGRWLRATSLDELPQLLNVLRGEMSLVGPRPLPLRDNQLLESWHKQRHVVLPGLTGLWQVSGRSNTSFADMIRLDLQYVDSWSLWLDLSIAWRTLKAVAGGRGAC
jgi:exopolysaccharide biosynthesis polyprenyl glycosylphosphotransferase